MITSRRDITDTRVELSVKLQPEELKSAQLVALKRLSGNVKVPGFRTGKAPASMILKYVDQNQLLDQTLDAALSRGVADAFTEAKLQVLDRPSVEIKKFVPESELEFTAEAEIIPTIKLADYKKLAVKRPKVSVSKTEVENVVTRIRDGLAEKKSVSRPAEIGDEVVIDFTGRINGEAFEGGSATDYTLVLGSGAFIPGFEDGIVGHKQDETFDVPVTFPQEYQVAKLKGANAVFEVTIKKLSARILPEIDDNFAAKAGPFKTVAEMMDDIRSQLKAQKETEADDQYKDALVKALADKSEVPLPEILVKDQVEMVERDLRQNLSYRGLTLEDYLESQNFSGRDDWLQKEVRPVAEERVKAGLVLSELSSKEKITVTKEEIASRKELYRQQYGRTPMNDQLDSEEAERDIANRLLTEKTVNRLAELNSKSAE